MQEKHKGLIAYLLGWLGGLIVLYAFKDNTKLTKFHACQAIVLSASSMVIGLVLGFIPYIKYAASIINLLIFVAQIIGMVKAFHEEEFEIPVFSDLTRNIFKKQLEDDNLQ